MSHPDLLVGTATADDAAVWRRPDGRALVATTDFFTPIVDDPALWGAIAATNAASDVFAMGGTPMFALALVAWPRDELSMDLLGEVLAGGQECAENGGWIVVGGHTVDGPEPTYGQAVVGEIDPDRMLTNDGGLDGQTLVLSKALGTGIVATATKRLERSDVEPGGSIHETYQAAVDSMVRLNDVGARVALAAGAAAGTDVTGFGLLGHLQKIAAGSGLDAVVHADALPVLPGVRALIDQGFVPGGTMRNLEYVQPSIDRGDATTDADLVLLADAQTSGGMLVAVDPAAADDAVAELIESGHAAAAIGTLRSPTAEPGALIVR